MLQSSSIGLGFMNPKLLPPLSLLNSWDMTSEQNVVERRVNEISNGGWCYLAVKLGAFCSDVTSQPFSRDRELQIKKNRPVLLIHC